MVTSNPPVIAPASSPSNSNNALSPALVAVIGVLASAFLILSYYRIFSKYCTRWQRPPQFINRDQGYSEQTIEVVELWPATSPGLEESLIRRIPTCSYKANEGLVGETECAVCLGEFEERDALRVLPKCNHAFHTPCIDTWLQSNSTCPLCRINIGLAAGLPHALMPLPLSHLEADNSPAVEVDASRATAERPLPLSQLSEFWSSSNSSQISFVTAPDSASSDDEGEHLVDSEASRLHVAQFENIQETGAVGLEETQSASPRSRTITGNAYQSSKSPVQLSKSAKRKLHNRASSVGSRLQDVTDQSTTERTLTRQSSDPDGKHPLVGRMSPLRRNYRFARMVRSYSTGSAGSANASHVVVELLMHEILMSDKNIGPAGSGSYSSSLPKYDSGLDASGSEKPGCSIPDQRDAGLVTNNSVTASGPFVVVDLTNAMDQQSQGNLQTVPLLQHIDADPKQSGDDDDAAYRLHHHCNHSPTASLVEQTTDSKSAMPQDATQESQNSAASRALKSRSFRLSMFKGMKRSGSGGRSGGLPSSVFNTFRGSHKVHASQPDGVFEFLEFV